MAITFAPRRLAPADSCELPVALRPGPAHREKQAIRGVCPLQVVRDFRAERAVGERHGRIALNLGGDAVLDRHQHAAGIRTVVRTGSAYDLGAHAVILRPSASSRSSIQ